MRVSRWTEELGRKTDPCSVTCQHKSCTSGEGWKELFRPIEMCVVSMCASVSVWFMCCVVCWKRDESELEI
jgi:hypothetical protein